jgi:hypothetical protein|tara:strand:- start:524 stop:1522 length:999 start_codon:yes stop_codon:yes gene_type:complete
MKISNFSKLSEIFDIVYGVNLELYELEQVSGKKGIPFVSRTSQNNGVSAYVMKIDDLKPNPGHTLSVAGGGSVLETFYQSQPYYSGRDLYYLKPKKILSEKEMLIYCSLIYENKYKFSYGRQANKSLKDLKLPHTDEVKKIANIIDYPKPPSNKSKSSKHISLNKKAWKNFYVYEIFNVIRGIGSVNLDISEIKNEDYNLLYLRPSNNYNLVGGYLDKENIKDSIFPKGSLVMGNTGEGSHTYCYIANEEFLPNNNLSVLQFKAGNTNLLHKLFLIPIIEHNRFRYAYGRIPSNTRFLNSKLKLPVDDKNSIDWMFMESYIKTLPGSNFKFD